MNNFITLVILGLCVFGVYVSIDSATRPQSDRAALSELINLKMEN